MNEDFRLKKGDIVDYKTKTGNKVRHIVGGFFDKKSISCFEEDGSKVLKVKRATRYEIVWEKKEILDEKEKEYLSAVIKPFRNRVKYIKKVSFNSEKEFIRIDLEGDYISLPNFEKNTMYKGMELSKEYTLEELGL